MAFVLKARRLDADVWTLARERIHRAYDTHDRVAVSFSGGKDSTVILHAALAVAEERNAGPVDVFHWDVEAIDPDTIDYVTRVANMGNINFRWLCLPGAHRNGCSTSSPFWHPWHPDERHLWVRDMPPGAITHFDGFRHNKMQESNSFLFPDDGKTTAVLLGLRADESLSRRRSVSNRREDNYISHDQSAPGVSLVKPIYDWTTNDVWVAPRLFGWDYNRAYDAMALAGISPHQQRVAPPFGEQPMKSLWMYQQCWPELWDKLCYRVPGAQTAARYANTELYGAGGTSIVRPPDGMTWQEAIAYYLDRHPPTVRAFCAGRIRSFIMRHRSKTTRPIPETSPDEQTGVSWSWLLRVAIRGDIAGREDPNDNIDVNKRWKFEK